MVYRYKTSKGKYYHLNETVSPKNKSPIRYFTRKRNPRKGIDLPEGYNVMESKTGLPFLTKIKIVNCIDCKKDFEQSRSNQQRCPKCQVAHRKKVINENAKKFYTKKARKRAQKKKLKKAPKQNKVKKTPKKKGKRSSIKSCIKGKKKNKRKQKQCKKGGKRGK